MVALSSHSRYAPRPAAPTVPVVLYGRGWCAMSQMARRHLDRMGIPFEYVDLDRHPEVESRLAWLTGGRVHSPVVSVGGEVLVQPTIRELDWALARRGL